LYLQQQNNQVRSRSRQEKAEVGVVAVAVGTQFEAIRKVIGEMMGMHGGLRPLPNCRLLSPSPVNNAEYSYEEDSVTSKEYLLTLMYPDKSYHKRKHFC
jgi:hypothetical protein